LFFFAVIFKIYMLVRMKIYRNMLVSLIPASLLMVSVSAFSDNFPLITPNDRAENYQRQLELKKSIQLETDSSRKKALGSEAPGTENLPDAKGSATYFVNAIGVDAGIDMPVVEVEDIITRYKGRSLNVADIYALIKEVGNRYIERGYTTTTITLKPTDLKAGKIQLMVLWGRVEGWLIEGRPLTTWKEKWLQHVSLPDVIGEPLNIYAVDRSIEVLNNGAKSVKVEVLPGSKLGYSNLNVIEVAGSPSFNVGVNSQSVETTANGRYVGNMGAGIGDLLLPNDRVTASGSSRYYDEPFGNDEYTANVGYSIPIGYSDVALRYAKSTYHKEIVGGFGNYGSKGDSTTLGMKFIYNIWRNRTDKLSVYSDFEAKDSYNYIGDVLLDVNSKPYRSFTFGYTYVGAFLGGTIYSDMSLSKGLSIFGGEGAAVDSSGNSKNFRRAKADVSWTYPFAIFEFPLDYAVRTSAQYSRDSMVSSYKMGVGDEFTVRGYKGTPAWGDQGAVLSNTLSHTYAIATAMGPAALQISTGLDWGRVRDVDYSGGEGHTLAGGGVGVSASLKKISLSLGYGVPFKKVQGVEIPSEVVYLNLGVGF
jgi:hemolysin activation/secretion protein